MRVVDRSNLKIPDVQLAWPLPRLLPRLEVLDLRSRLLVGYALVILLCLGLAGSSFIYQIRDYQQQAKLNRLADLVLPLSVQVQVLQAAGASPLQIARFLEQQATEMGVRILVLDRQGAVLLDTSRTLDGREVRLSLDSRVRQVRGAVAGQFDGPGVDPFYFVAGVYPKSIVSIDGDRFLSRGDQIVALAVPEQSLAASWLELAPSLGIAGLIGLVVSILIAVGLARSIARPVTDMTKAAEEIARGQYDQTISVRGNDEIARLAQSFNTMAREVGRSQRLLRDFLADASHELKTPLTSIQGFSQAIVDGTVNDAEGYAAAGQIIHEEAMRMRLLVDDLLYLSKLESGQVSMDLGSFDLGALVKAQLRRIGHAADEKGVAIDVQTDEPLSIVGDERRIEQVLGNLLGNAVRHTPAGGRVALTVETSGPQSPVEIRVHNTGSYIPPDVIDRIFDRFFQADASRSQEGSGLGLAIVREIVAAHGGEVQATSDREHGTEFKVRLPKLGPVGHNEFKSVDRSSG